MGLDNKESNNKNRTEKKEKMKNTQKSATRPIPVPTPKETHFWTQGKVELVFLAGILLGVLIEYLVMS